MKKLTIIPLILLLFISIGCDTKQKGPTHLEVGRARLIESGNAVEAVDFLIEAEKKEDDKAEPRSLLVIAYSHALASGATRGQQYESEYQRQRKDRIAALNDAEMDKMIEILSKRSQVQQNGFQALVDKGADAAPILIKHLVENTYPDIQKNLTTSLIKMKSKAVDSILDSITDAATPPAAKVKLIRILGEIGDKKAIERLKAIDIDNLPATVKMELYTTLYRLGDTKYKVQILAGLTTDEVEVRRAAAKAMSNLKDVNKTSLIRKLKDDDPQVVTDIVKSLSVHKTRDAVTPLLNVLKIDDTTDDGTDKFANAKKEVLNTLESYIEAGGELKKGIAKELAYLIIKKEISSDNVRLQIVQFLKKPEVVKSLKAINVLEGINSELHTAAQGEQSNFVKTAFNELLEKLK